MILLGLHPFYCPYADIAIDIHNLVTKNMTTAGLTKKALQTRSKLKTAARKLINKDGYSSVRVEDVTIEAQLSKGLFYRYFKDLFDITNELCMELVDEVLQRTELDENSGGMSSYDWFYQHLFTPIESFANNPGLLACMFERQGKFPQISELWSEKGHTWNLRVAKYLTEQVGMKRVEAERIASLLGAITEGVIYQDLVRGSPDLQRFGDKPEVITEIIATIWYRFVFLELPREGKRKFDLPLGVIEAPSPLQAD